MYGQISPGRVSALRSAQDRVGHGDLALQESGDDRAGSGHASHRLQLLRVLMQRAAREHRASLSKINFKRTLDSPRHFADAIQAMAGKPRRQQ